MKHLSVMLAASTLVLASCTSAPATSGSESPPATSASVAPLPSAPPTAAAGPLDAALVSAGQQVFATYCAVCHNGADDTAPQIDQLHTFDPQRVSTALSEGGLMTLQSKMLTAEQRTHGDVRR